MSDKPRVAYLHKANDNYYTDQQVEHGEVTREIIDKSYLTFIEIEAYEATIRERDELRTARDNWMRHCELTFPAKIELLIQERDEARAELSKMSDVSFSRKDWIKESILAQRELMAERERSARLVSALERIAKSCQSPDYEQGCRVELFASGALAAYSAGGLE